MFKIKKIVAMICMMAMVITALAIPASATNPFKITLSDAENNAATSTYAFFTVNLDGLEGTYSKAGTIKLRFTPGVFSAAALRSLDEDGLYSDDEASGPETFNAKFLAGDEYDQVTITWFGSYAVTTTTGKLAEIRMKYANGEKEAEITQVNAAEDSVVCISLCDAEGNVTVDKQLFADRTCTYKLVGDKITEVTGGNDPAPATTATVVDDYTGDKETEGDEADTTDKAVAILGTPAAPESRATSLVWTVTPNTGDAQQFTQAVDVEGGATYKFGLVLRNITADLIKTVSAVLQ